MTQTAIHRHSLSGLRLVQFAALLVACSSGCGSEGGGGGGGGGDGGTGGGGAGSPSSGGAGAGVQDPAAATSAEQCVYEGGGGNNGFYCDAVTIQLSQALPFEGLSVIVTTSLGDTFDELYSPFEGPSSLAIVASGDPVEAMILQVITPPPHYDATWVDVELKQGTTVVGSAHFETLAYKCYANTIDDWCWEADPVTLEVTLP